MRPTTWLSLVATCLLGAAARAEPSAPQPAGKGNVDWSYTAAGYGENWDDAWSEALKEAQGKAADRLRQQIQGLGWTPSADDLQRWGAVQEVSRNANTPRQGLFEVKLKVTLTKEMKREVWRRDLQQCVQERQLLAAKVLAALVALLAVGAGYFRLEEMTRGYFTGVLRLLLLAGAGAIGVGLWLVL
jgi:hypothetical protein